MKLYTYHGTPISDVSTATLQDCLQTGVEIISEDTPGEGVNSVLEQIRLELYIRALGLTSKQF